MQYQRDAARVLSVLEHLRFTCLRDHGADSPHGCTAVPIIKSKLRVVLYVSAYIRCEELSLLWGHMASVRTIMGRMHVGAEL